LNMVLKYLFCTLCGTFYALLVLLLARFFVCGLAALTAAIGPMAGLDAESADYAVRVLSQLKSARLILPWPSFLLGGAGLGLLVSRGRFGRKKVLLCMLCALLFLLPLTLAALWFTQINDIQVGRLLLALFPMLPHLL